MAESRQCTLPHLEEAVGATAQTLGCRGCREPGDVADSAGARDCLSGVQPAELGPACHVMRGRSGVM